METSSQPVLNASFEQNDGQAPLEDSPNVLQASSQAPLDISSQTEDKKQAKALLSEARNTRDMLVNFRAAVESGTYAGVRMMDVAKGMAFLEAILGQNQAHIKNLQGRLDA